MNKIAEGTIKRIHVDKNVLASNRKHGKDDPAWTIQTSKGSFKAKNVSWNGITVTSPPGKVLSCGARMWLETYAEVNYE